MDFFSKLKSLIANIIGHKLSHDQQAKEHDPLVEAIAEAIKPVIAAQVAAALIEISQQLQEETQGLLIPEPYYEKRHQLKRKLRRLASRRDTSPITRQQKPTKHVYTRPRLCYPRYTHKTRFPLKR